MINGMRQTRWIALSLLILSACGGAGTETDFEGADFRASLTDAERAPTQTTLYRGPAVFEKYVQKFLANARSRDANVIPYTKNPRLVMRIASLDSYGPRTIGLCQSSSTVRRVTIDPDFWNSASASAREQVIHHELGHCVLDRRHLQTKLSSGIPKSMMYPKLLSANTYQNNRTRYLTELFTSPLVGVNLRMEALETGTEETESMDEDASDDSTSTLEDVCTLNGPEDTEQEENGVFTEARMN